MKFKTRILASWIRSLYDAYCDAVQNFIPEDAHEQLLLEHARELQGRISTQLLNDQEKYTLTLTSVESLAFLQWWSINPCNAGSLEQVCIGELISKIDRKAKSPRRRL